jgi:hypothetical protein
LTRTLPALLVLALLTAATLVFALDPELYFRARVAAGLKPFAPFLDLHGVQAAIACHHRGIDVYAENPCDALGRLHSYSPLWLRLPAWSAAPGLLHSLGLATAAGFAAALLLLPRGPGGIAGLAMVLAAVSPVTYFALERANIDVPIFIAVAAGAALLGRGMPARLAGHALFLAAGLLKFYPLVLLALLAREGWRRALALGLAAAALGLAALWPLRAEIAPALANVPVLPAFSNSFGAPVLARDIAALLPGLPWLPAALTVLAGAAALLLALAAVRHAPPGLPARHRHLVLAGALVGVGCFLAGESVEYRAIFLLLPLPALLWMAQHHRGFALAAAATVWLLWDPLLRRIVARLWRGAGDLPSWPSLALWSLRELLWWGLIAALAGLLAALWRVDTSAAPVTILPGTEGETRR